MNRGAEIIKLIEENPGIKFREIMRETQMKNGVLSYHVKRLEESGSVKIERKSGQTRFYPLCHRGRINLNKKSETGNPTKNNAYIAQ